MITHDRIACSSDTAIYSFATTPCRHRFFFGVGDPKLTCWRINMATIERMLPRRDYRVRCGHCGLRISGSNGHGGEVLEVVWMHSGKTWYGEFHFPEFAYDLQGNVAQ